MEENNTNVQEVERPRTKKSTLKMGNDDHPELVSGQPVGGGTCSCVNYEVIGIPKKRVFRQFAGGNICRRTSFELQKDVLSILLLSLIHI